ncbi:hypothetical protein C9374_005183 [Naegleria lovaniensis]|uniref:Maleylacetoacetate isomerase n=1 Tax=Naegleria lovaniensis TaxID=51637 RepID=A0AA88GR24_NAELO|nr:uncharacterized protein C9374_005183 [Naegleria lovaniensis]KAG2382603.1 hypothetical protein C9374_005183 [Naegleria lovaniensis]
MSSSVSTPSSSTITLYSFKPSSSSWRVRAALYHKKLWPQVTIEEISLLDKVNEKQEYRDVNPMGQVPCLVIHDQVLTQSIPIIEYLEAVFPNHGHDDSTGDLIPKDPILAFKVRQLSEIINSGIQPMHNGRAIRMLPEQQRTEWMEYWVRNGLSVIEKILCLNYPNALPSNEDYKYCIPQYGKLSMADICLVPQVFVAKTRTSINVDEEFPITSKVYSNLIKMEEFVQTHPQLK